MYAHFLGQSAQHKRYFDKRTQLINLPCKIILWVSSLSLTATHSMYDHSMGQIMIIN